MLHPRLRIALAILMPLALVSVVASVAWIGVHLQGGDIAARERWQPIFRLDPARVTALRVATGGDDVRLVRAEKGWRIRSPVEAEADPAAVRAILGRLATIQRRATVAPAGESPERLRPYGLDAPTALLEVTVEGGRTERLALGASTGREGAMFAMPTSGDVVVVPGDARDVLEKRLADLRAPPPGPAPSPAPGPAPTRRGG